MVRMVLLTALAGLAVGVPLGSAVGLAQSAVPQIGLSQFGVSPLRLSASNGQEMTQLRVRNRASAALKVQVRAFEWHQIDGKDRYERASDVRISPSIVAIDGYRDQTFNIVLPRQTGTGERRYRIVVDELPGAVAEMRTGTQPRLRMTVPLFIGSDTATPAKFEAKAGSTGLMLTNTGGRTAKVTRLTVKDRTGTSIPLDLAGAEYFHGGTSRAYSLPQPLTCGPGLQADITVEGQKFDVPLPETCS